MEVKASVGFSYAFSHRKLYPKPTSDDEKTTTHRA